MENIITNSSYICFIYIIYYYFIIETTSNKVSYSGLGYEWRVLTKCWLGSYICATRPLKPMSPTPWAGPVPDGFHYKNDRLKKNKGC